MNKCLRVISIWFNYGVVLTILQSCAGQAGQGADNRLKELEKQVIQLKAENSNLQSRTRELDDKVLLYEKKATLSDRKQSRDGMRTVRLSPDGVAEDTGYPADNEFEEEEASVSFRQQYTEDDKRPVLRLDERAIAAYDSGVPVTNGSNSSAASRSWKDIPVTNRGDNLGVLTSDGQLQQAEADSMELFNAAYRSYNNKDYAGALAGFSTFLQRESNHRFADNAMFWIAECYLAQGKLFKAVGEFERLLRRYPRSEQAASSLYRIGFIYDQMQDSVKAKEYYFKVVENFPGTDAARKASKRMSDYNGDARLVRTSATR